MMDNVSTADLLAMRGNDNGFGGFGGGDNALWVVLFLIFGMGGFGGFGGNRGFGEAATAAAQNEILLGQQFAGVNTKLNELGNGICNSTYALNNAITGEGRAMQTQLAECCCGIQNAIREEGAATRSMIQSNEIQTLRDKVTDLQVQASQCRQNEYLVSTLRPCPVPAYLTCSPYQSYGGCCNGFGGGYQPNI